jgi:DNA-binding XRE family transcriptional regulator
MDQNIFWDRKITPSDAAAILKNPEHPRFAEIAALLLSRTNDLKLVFLEYLDKRVFVGEWRRIKMEMRKNQWSDERIDLWGQVHKTLSAKIENKGGGQKPARVQKSAEFDRIGWVLRSERKKQGIAQQVLAKQANISQQTVSNAENGKGDISLRTLKRILTVLNLEFNIRPKAVTGTSFTFND